MPKEEAKEEKKILFSSPTPEKKPAKEEPAKEETVSVSKEEWEKMQKDISNLKKGQTDEGLDPMKPKDRIVKVRMYEGKPIVDVGKVYIIKDEHNEPIEWIDVTVKGVEEPVKMLFHDFRFLDKDECKVVSEDKQEVREHQGGEYTTKKTVDGYKTVSTGEKVPIVVVSPKSVFKVELKDGSVVELTEEAIN